MTPGEIFPAAGEIILNKDGVAISLTVANTGDRPIQVGSHYHFAETNAALAFDRQAALGYRLDIPAGTAVRFEPGAVARCFVDTVSGCAAAVWLQPGGDGSAASRFQRLGRLNKSR